jgi:NAD(P)-dependent dehydrogenase (short-subunit alcohol dehydrogenase family)
LSKIAVVTGAGSGIGRACADRLVSTGWSVIGWDLKPGSNTSVAWRTVDVADCGSVSDAAADVQEADLLINSAGVSARAPASEMSVADWDRVIAVDLSGTFYCCRYLHRALSLRQGTVANIASIAAHRSFAGRANYCSAKAGVVALTEVLAQEWASDGIRVFAVSPGFVRTEMWDVGVAIGKIPEDAVQARTPQRRQADPDELAQALIALADQQFAYMTGVPVIIDGGWCANGGF